MTETNDADSNQKKVRQKKKKIVDPILKRIFIFGGLALAVLIGFTFALPAGRILFFTQNFLSLVVVIAIAIQAMIYGQQREIMEKAADYTKIGERAYLGIDAVDFDGPKVGEKAAINIAVLNGGRTPAWNVKVPIRLTIGTEFPSEEPQMSDKEGSTFLPAGIRRNLHLETPFAFNPQSRQQIISGERKIFIHGKAYFRDAWRDKRHFTFKLVYRPDGNVFVDYKEADQKT